MVIMACEVMACKVMAWSAGGAAGDGMANPGERRHTQGSCGLYSYGW